MQPYSAFVKGKQTFVGEMWINHYICEMLLEEDLLSKIWKSLNISSQENGNKKEK